MSNCVYLRVQNIDAKYSSKVVKVNPSFCADMFCTSMSATRRWCFDVSLRARLRCQECVCLNNVWLKVFFSIPAHDTHSLTSTLQKTT